MVLGCCKVTRLALVSSCVHLGTGSHSENHPPEAGCCLVHPMVSQDERFLVERVCWSKNVVSLLNSCCVSRTAELQRHQGAPHGMCFRVSGLWVSTRPGNIEHTSTGDEVVRGGVLEYPDKLRLKHVLDPWDEVKYFYSAERFLLYSEILKQQQKCSILAWAFQFSDFILNRRNTFQ